jgi:hypothetical protein
LITEPAALLLVEVEREADTAVYPTLADLAQPPYSPGARTRSLRSSPDLRRQR